MLHCGSENGLSASNARAGRDLECGDLGRCGPAASEDWTALAIGFLVSGVIAFIAVKWWLLRYIQTHRFTVFGCHRIVLDLALLMALD